jgi:hypothetical protein
LAKRRCIFRIARGAAESTHPVVTNASSVTRRTCRFIQLVFSIGHGLLVFCPTGGASHAWVRFSFSACNVFNRCCLSSSDTPANASLRVTSPHSPACSSLLRAAGMRWRSHLRRSVGCGFRLINLSASSLSTMRPSVIGSMSSSSASPFLINALVLREVGQNLPLRPGEA